VLRLRFVHIGDVDLGNGEAFAAEFFKNLADVTASASGRNQPELDSFVGSECLMWDKRRSGSGCLDEGPSIHEQAPPWYRENQAM
jgi:hypothetical protein